MTLSTTTEASKNPNGADMTIYPEVFPVKYDGSDFSLAARPAKDGWDSVKSWTWPYGVFGPDDFDI